MIFLSFSVIFGTSIAYSDYKYAGVYRRLAEKVCELTIIKHYLMLNI